MKKSEQFIKLQEEIEALALRWVKAWGENTDYRYVSNVRIVLYKHPSMRNQISFNAGITDGFPKYQEIALDYLDDDLDLEKDSKAIYEDEKLQINEKYKKIATLEIDPNVREYLRLKDDSSVQFLTTYPAKFI